MSRTVRWLFFSSGLYLLLVSLAMGFMVWLVLVLLSKLLPTNPRELEKLPRLVVRVVALRAWSPALALPPLLCGLVTMRARRGQLAWSIAGLVFLILPLVLVLYCFIMLIAPYYTIQPL